MNAAVWCIVVNALVPMIKVVLPRVWLVLGWVTICRQPSHLGHDKSHGTTRFFIPMEYVNWTPSGGFLAGVKAERVYLFRVADGSRCSVGGIPCRAMHTV